MRIKVGRDKMKYSKITCLVVGAFLSILKKVNVATILSTPESKDGNSIPESYRLFFLGNFYSKKDGIKSPLMMCLCNLCCRTALYRDFSQGGHFKYFSTISSYYSYQHSLIIYIFWEILLFLSVRFNSGHPV